MTLVQTELGPLIDILRELLQSQTDTLALIVAIMVLVVVIVTVIVVWNIFRTSRAKVVIPGSEDKPQQVVSEKEFMGIVFNTLLERLNQLNKQNESLSAQNTNQDARLEQSIKAFEALVAPVDVISKRLALTPTVTDMALNAHSVDALGTHIDERLGTMASSRKELNDTMTTVSNGIEKLSKSDAEMLEKLTAALVLLDKLDKRTAGFEERLTALETAVRTASNKYSTLDIPLPPSDVPTPPVPPVEPKSS
jgi:uncharacterized phage infection (PIP) family protein YhgE